MPENIIFRFYGSAISDYWLLSRIHANNEENNNFQDTSERMAPTHKSRPCPNIRPNGPI